MFEIETHIDSSPVFWPARDIQEPELCLLEVWGILQHTCHNARPLLWIILRMLSQQKQRIHSACLFC